MIKAYDIKVERSEPGTKKRFVHFGGEKLRRIEIQNEFIGSAINIRVIYSESKTKQKKGSFEEMCIRTGHKPHDGQGIDGSKYGYKGDGSVFKK